jgi:hypothetical protein
MVARTTGEAFAEIRQAADAWLSRSDNAPRNPADSSEIQYAPSDEHTIYEGVAFYFF